MTEILRNAQRRGSGLARDARAHLERFLDNVFRLFTLVLA
jgi:hypothetical protein